MAKQWGVAEFKFLDMPHPIANLTQRTLDKRVENLVKDFLGLLQKGQL